MRFERWLYTVPLRFRSLFRRSAVERELDDELRDHVERETLANLDRGMSEHDARAAALRSIGGIELRKEECRDTRRTRPLEDLVRDVRFGARVLGRRPGFTAVAVATLALGIGANTAIFSVVDAILLQRPAYQDPDRLVKVWEEAPDDHAGGLEGNVSPANFADLESQASCFNGLAVYGRNEANLSDNGEPERIQVSYVSPNLFDVLGVTPLAGRGFTPDEGKEGGEKVTVLGERLWKRRFGSDPSIVGRTVQFDGKAYTVVGIVPAAASFPMPLDAWIASSIPDDVAKARGIHFLGVVGRLRDGISLREAQSEVDGLGARLAQAYPQTNKDRSFGLATVHDRTVRSVRPMLLALLAAVGFVLLIACANVANLLLVRISSRQSEISVRAALGASRGRLARQFLTESVVLAVGGSLVGVVVATVAVRALVAFGPQELEKLGGAAIDLRVLAFTLGLTVVTGLLFGVVPALRALRPDLNEALKEGARSVASDRGRGRTSAALVVVEVALSLVLLVAAGLLLRSFVGLVRVDPGLDPTNVTTLCVSLPEATYPDDARASAFYRDAISRIAALPGVASVGAVNSLPLSGDGATSWIHFEGRPDPANEEPPEVNYRVATPDYFRTLHIPLLAGRGFEPTDTQDADAVVLVSDEVARRFYPSGDAVGKRIKLGPHPENDRWITIVGIVGSVRHGGLSAAPAAEVYHVHGQDSWSRMSFVVRADGSPTAVATAATKQINAIDPKLPVFQVRTMRDVIAESVAAQRFAAALIGAFAALALGLAAVGLYSVIAYSVSQRTHEIGIRMALGARSGNVVGMVVRHGMSLALVGLGIGLVAAFALTRFLSSMIVGVSTTDPATFVAISALLAATALAACYVPARRAARIDPMRALRDE